MEDSFLLSRAFEVEPLSDNFDPSVPPSTGNEYLQHVMYVTYIISFIIIIFSV